METKKQILEKLPNFCGTKEYHEISIFPLLATDGVAYLVKAADAYWLADLIGAEYFSLLQNRKEARFWTLNVDHKNRTAVLIGEYDTGIVLSKVEIDMTDFPLDKAEIWIFGGVMVLPSEY